MRYKFIQTAVALGVSALILSGCGKGHEAESEAKKESAAAETPWKLSRNTNGETVITLATQTRMGLKVEALAAMQLAPETKVYGRVLDASLLATAAAEVAVARATAEASQKDFERNKTLAEQNNASVRVLQAAEAAARRDAVLTEAAQIRFRASWGAALADSKNLQELLQALGNGTSALVRLDTRIGEPLKVEPRSARIFSLADESNSVEAKFVGPAANVDALTQGQGFLFLVSDKAAMFKPGGAVYGFIQGSGEAQKGVRMPLDAVVFAGGLNWIYVETGERQFTRKTISTEHPVEGGYFVPEGLSVDEKVVIVGGQQLLSEELKGQIQPD